MIHYLVPRSQAFGMADYLDLWGAAVGQRLRVEAYEDLVGRRALPAGTWILSAIDQLSPPMTRFLEEVEGRLRASGRARVLNSVTGTRTRLSLLQELHRQGINPFRAVRAPEAPGAGLSFPVFVRQEKGHTGSLTPLLRSERELMAALRRLAWAGWRREHLLVVEFCDTSDAAGLYRKYAAFFVGDRVIPRSLARGPDWMLKHGTGTHTEASLTEERAYVDDNPHAEALVGIARAAGAEWGRIDYALKDGRIVVWEINLNPTIGRGRRPSKGSIPPELRPLRDAARERFYRDFAAAFETVDTTETGDVPIPDSIDRPPPEGVLSAALLPPRAALWVRLARPVHTLVKPLLGGHGSRRTAGHPH